MLKTGLIIGCMSFLAIVILVEKLPKKIKPFVLGHHLKRHRKSKRKILLNEQ